MLEPVTEANPALAKTDATATLVELATSEVFRDTSKLNLDGFWIAGGARFSF